MRTSTRIISGLVGVTLAGGLMAGLSGCASIEPKLAFGKAYGSTISQKDLSTKVSFSTTPADMEKLMAALDDSSSGTPVPKAVRKSVAEILPKLSITSRVHSNGAPLSEETDRTKLDEASTFALDGAGIDVVRMGNEAYVKADIAGIGQKTGLFTATQVHMMTDQIPRELSWVNELVDGKWIGLPTSTVQSMLKDKSGSNATDPVAMKKIREKVQSSLERDATFEKTGSRDGADEMTVKVKVKPFAKDLEEISKEQGNTPSASPSATVKTDDLKDDATLVVRTLVKDDRVIHAETDIPQMFDWADTSKMSAKSKAGLEKIKASGFHGAIVMDFSTNAGSVTKPTGARMLTDADIENMKRLSQPTSHASQLPMPTAS